MSTDILDRASPGPSAHIPWGSHPTQFGDLFLPSKKGPHPVVIAVHGGFWREMYDLHHLAFLCTALAQAGYAVWSLEYRRLGEAGGGWPGTFEDVAAGSAHLKEIASKHHLDLQHVISLGHSAGGHLALWLGATHRLKARGVHPAPTMPLRGVVALAAVSDLRYGSGLKLSNGVVDELMGGAPDVVADRYAVASPAELLPLEVGQRIVHGTHDDIVPFEMSRRYVEKARKAGDAAVLETIDGAGHFELINPDSIAWPRVLESVRAFI